MIRTFLFDMGNVLVFFSHELMCEQIGNVCGKSGAEIWKLLFDSGLQADFERGRISEQEFHSRFEQDLGRKISFEDLRTAGSDIFRLNDPMPGILDSLKRQGYRLVLLSNTSVSHFEWVWERFDVLQKFDDYVASYRVGAIKPEPGIFEAALEKINCEPAECFYTDDIARYVEIGRGYGLQAELFTDADSLLEQLQQREISVTPQDES